MKWLISLGGAALLLAAFGLYPFRSQSVEKLLPIQTIVVGRDPAGVYVQTDNDLSGKGRDYKEAMQQLEQTAQGVAFFGTCSAIVIVGKEELLEAVAEDARLRSAAAVYWCGEDARASMLQKTLEAHSGNVKLLDVRLGERKLPWVVQEEGGWRVNDVS